MFFIYVAIFATGSAVTLYAVNFKSVNTYITTNVMAARELWAKYRAKP